MALGRSRAAALRASGGSPAGFRRIRWSAHRRQECCETPQHAGRGQTPGPLRTLPRQPSVGDPDARQPELGVGGQDQPGPPVGLFGVSEPRSGPAQGLLQEADSVFEVEPAAVRLPEEVEIRLALPAPPQSQLLGLAGLPGQLAHLDQDHIGSHDGRSLAPVALPYAPGLGVQPQQAPDAHRAVIVALAAVLGRRLRPTRAILEVELLAVAARASDWSGKEGSGSA
jgi:hypothetical protein